MIAAASLLLGATALLIRKMMYPPLKTVDEVDLDKYLGRWYEIAAIPKFSQRGCSYTTAVYSKNEDGSLSVRNSCLVGDEEKSIMGKAIVAEPETNAKLDIQFFWPFKGKYWILDLAADYSYAMVGHPDRNSLWILSRKPWLEKDVYKQLLVSAMGKGFDISRIRVTRQRAAEEIPVISD